MVHSVCAFQSSQFFLAALTTLLELCTLHDYDTHPVIIPTEHMQDGQQVGKLQAKLVELQPEFNDAPFVAQVETPRK